MLVYFAVAKKGDPPTDGKTDVNPEGLTAAYGPHAAAVAARLHAAGLSCKVGARHAAGLLLLLLLSRRGLQSATSVTAAPAPSMLVLPGASVGSFRDPRSQLGSVGGRA